MYGRRRRKCFPLKLVHLCTPSPTSGKGNLYYYNLNYSIAKIVGNTVNDYTYLIKCLK
jgi:hypothetical protein